MSYKKEKKININYIIFLLLLLLVLIIGFSTFDFLKTKKNNSLNLEKIEKIEKILYDFKNKNNSLPGVSGNKNYFLSNGYYAHKNEKNIYGVYGLFSGDFLNDKQKNYLIDSNLNSYFSYGKKIDNSEFQIAGVISNNGTYTTKLKGNYSGKNGPISLIREYNGPNFIQNNSNSHFPYNPVKKYLTAKINNLEGKIKINGKKINNFKNIELKGKDKIELEKNNFAEIYISDGSFIKIGSIKEKTVLNLEEMLLKEDSPLKTKINLFLTSGKIFIKATSLSDNSNFSITTQDITASVRGTIYLLEKNSNYTKVTLNIGEIDLEKKSGELIKNMKVLDYKNPQTIYIKSGKIINPDKNINSEINTKITENSNKEKNNSLNSKENQENLSNKEILKNIKENNFPEILKKENIGKYKNNFVDYDLGINYNLIAFAPFNNLGDLNLYISKRNKLEYKQNGILENNCLPNTKEIVKNGFKNNNCVNQLNKNNLNDKKILNASENEIKNLKLSGKKISFYEYKNNFVKNYNFSINNSFFDGVYIGGGKGEKGIILDNYTKKNIGDYLYYNLNKLNLDNNFVIEINAKIPDSKLENYLLNYGENFRLFVKDKKLFFNSKIIFPGINLKAGEFNKIFLIKKDNKIYLKIGKNKSIFTNQFFNKKLNEIYIGTYKVGNNYFKQFNNIIDYIKIYK